jgi:hypothetical protein
LPFAFAFATNGIHYGYHVAAKAKAKVEQRAGLSSLFQRAGFVKRPTSPFSLWSNQRQREERREKPSRGFAYWYSAPQRGLVGVSLVFVVVRSLFHLCFCLCRNMVSIVNPISGKSKGKRQEKSNEQRALFARREVGFGENLLGLDGVGTKPPLCKAIEGEILSPTTQRESPPRWPLFERALCALPQMGRAAIEPLVGLSSRGLCSNAYEAPRDSLQQRPLFAKPTRGSMAALREKRAPSLCSKRKAIEGFALQRTQNKKGSWNRKRKGRSSSL